MHVERLPGELASGERYLGTGAGVHQILGAGSAALADGAVGIEGVACFLLEGRIGLRGDKPLHYQLRPASVWQLRLGIAVGCEVLVVFVSVAVCQAEPLVVFQGVAVVAVDIAPFRIVCLEACRALPRPAGIEVKPYLRSELETGIASAPLAAYRMHGADKVRIYLVCLVTVFYDAVPLYQFGILQIPLVVVRDADVLSPWLYRRAVREVVTISVEPAVWQLQALGIIPVAAAHILRASLDPQTRDDGTVVNLAFFELVQPLALPVGERLGVLRCLVKLPDGDGLHQTTADRALRDAELVVEFLADVLQGGKAVGALEVYREGVRVRPWKAVTVPPLPFFQPLVSVPVHVVHHHLDELFQGVGEVEVAGGRASVHVAVTEQTLDEVVGDTVHHHVVIPHTLTLARHVRHRADGVEASVDDAPVTHGKRHILVADEADADIVVCHQRTLPRACRHPSVRVLREQVELSPPVHAARKPLLMHY